MIFETKGNIFAQKKGLLLHAMAVDGSQFRGVARLLSDEYFLIVPTFDGHHAEGKTVFTTPENQADKILAYLREQNITELDFVAGTSLGALVAFEIYRRGNLKVRKYVFDGGPFFLLNPGSRFGLFLLFLTPLKMLKICRRFARLGEKKFGFALTAAAVKVSKFITVRDIFNPVNAMRRAGIPNPLNEGNTRLVFLYGSRENAYRSFKRFRRMSGYEPVVKDGYGHCRYIMARCGEYAELLRS